MKLKDYIELMIDPVFIFSYYLGISSRTIDSCVTSNRQINNPLRRDGNPSASFAFRKGSLHLTDYAKPYYAGDVYHCVGIKLKKDCNNNVDFVFICQHIISTLIRNKENFKKYKKSELSPIDQLTKSYPKKTKFTTFTIKAVKWDNTNFLYWYNHIRPNKELGNILLHILQRWQIYPIASFWVNDNTKATRVYRANKPLYAYLLGLCKQGYEYKIYAPFDSNSKFFTNANNKFNYIDILKDSKYGVLAKSIKDAVFLTSTCEYLNLDDEITFIPVNSESSIIQNADYLTLKDKYEYLFSMFDWDKVGFLSAFRLSVLYAIEPIFITNSKFDPYLLTKREVELALNDINKDYTKTITVNDIHVFIKGIKIKRYSTKDYSDYLMKYGVDRGVLLFETYARTMIDKYEDLENQY